MNIRTTNVATRKSEDLIENGGVFHASNSHCAISAAETATLAQANGAFCLS